MRIRFPVPSILDRYIATQFWGPFMLAIGGFAIMGAVDILFYLIEIAVLSGVPAGVVLKLLVYKLPGIMVLFFPMAVLFSVMLLLVRMAKDQELTILRTSGVNMARVWIPLWVMAFLATGLSFWLNEKVVPYSNGLYEMVVQRQIQRSPPPQVVENVVLRDGNRFFYVQKADSKTHQLEHVLIFEQQSGFPRVTTALKAQWSDQAWKLSDGRIYDFDADGQLSFSSRFDTSTIRVDESVRSFYEPPKTPMQMDSGELRQKIRALRQAGVDTQSLRVEYYLKKSLPVACLVFGIVGIAFCLAFVKTGKDWWGIVVAICLAVVMACFYFFLVALCRAMGKDGHLPAFLAAWLPNFLYIVLGMGMILYQSVFR